MKALAISIAAVIALPTAANAKACRDSHGKFIKCPPAGAHPAAPHRCRDAKGHFTKCKK